MGKKLCDCLYYPDMHDEHGICVNWELHNSKPCPFYHTRRGSPSQRQSPWYHQEKGEQS